MHNVHYLDISLRSITIGLVLQVERVIPLKVREVDSKVEISTTFHCLCKCTCNTSILMHADMAIEQVIKFSYWKLTSEIHMRSVVYRIPVPRCGTWPICPATMMLGYEHYVSAGKKYRLDTEAKGSTGFRILKNLV